MTVAAQSKSGDGASGNGSNGGSNQAAQICSSIDQTAIANADGRVFNDVGGRLTSAGALEPLCQRLQ